MTRALSSIFTPPNVKQLEQMIGHARKGGLTIGLAQFDFLGVIPEVASLSKVSGSNYAEDGHALL